MNDRVVVSRVGAVAHVELNRADKRNGLDVAMFESVIAVGESLASDTSVRAVVLSGRGAAFCAGLDFSSFMADPRGPAILLARSPASNANTAQRLAWVWREVPVPVIAALHGPVFGGGLQLALACDVRIAAPTTELSVMEIEYGLIPDMTASRTLMRLVREDRARELVYTGRRVTATEALEIGLVTRLHDSPVEEALRMASEIAARSPDAVRANKRLFRECADLDETASLKREEELQLQLLGTPNQLEAVMAKIQKRVPSFSDPKS